MPRSHDPGDPRRLTPPILAAALALCSAGLVGAQWVGGVSGEWGFVLLSLAFPALLGALTARGRSVRSLWLTTGVLLEVSGVLVLTFSGSGAHVSWFGLPRASVVMLAGLGLLPLILIGLGFPIATARDARRRRVAVPPSEKRRPS